MTQCSLFPCPYLLFIPVNLPHLEAIFENAIAICLGCKCRVKYYCESLFNISVNWQVLSFTLICFSADHHNFRWHNCGSSWSPKGTWNWQQANKSGTGISSRSFAYVMFLGTSNYLNCDWCAHKVPSVMGLHCSCSHQGILYILDDGYLNESHEISHSAFSSLIVIIWTLKFWSLTIILYYIGIVISQISAVAAPPALQKLSEKFPG